MRGELRSENRHLSHIMHSLEGLSEGGSLRVGEPVGCGVGSGQNSCILHVVEAQQY